MEIQFEVITMPTAQQMRAVSAQRQAEIEYEREQKAKREEERLRSIMSQEIPRLVKFLNELIAQASERGSNQVFVNYNDETWGRKDPRCTFTFAMPGFNQSQYTEQIESIYRELGFEIVVQPLWTGVPTAYRNGYINISW